MTPLFLTVTFDTAAFPFQEVLARRVFRVPRLDGLHECSRAAGAGEELGYAHNLRLRRLMQSLPTDAPFYKLYHRFIARVIAPRYGGRVSYAAHPKMRVHLAGTGSVSEFHCDADVTGREDQLNCYLPFTDVSDGATLWCQREYGSNVYGPLNLRYGQALIWDGGRLRHGTIHNGTGLTRVSCDFRFSVGGERPVQSPWRDVLSRRPVALPAPSITPPVFDPRPLTGQQAPATPARAHAG